MASVVVANDAASFNSKGRVAICELDMPLRAMAASSSYGIPTQISGLLKTRLNQPRSTITVPSTDSTMLAFMIFIASFDDCFTWNLRRGWKAYLALWHFRGFDLRDFWFNAGYNSFLFPSPLVRRSNLDLRSFCSCIIFATLTALLIFFFQILQV